MVIGMDSIDYRPQMNLGAKSESPLKWTKCNPLVLFRELVLLARNFISGRCMNGADRSRMGRFDRLLMQVASEVGKMESEARRQEVASYVQIMAGLRFDKTLVKRLFREDIMKESVIYQEIFETGEQQGEQRALQREKALILRQISRRVGEVPPELRSSVELLSIDRLEALGEALLDFNNLQDLQNWLDPK